MRSDSPDDRGPPLSKVVLSGIVATLAWPLVIAPSLWRARRFHRVVRKASRWRHRIVADGVEVWRDAEAPRLISWAKLGAGRWIVHVIPSMASGDEEAYAVELLEEGVALSGEQLSLVLMALSERQLRPELEDGGRALGAAGTLMTMLWLGAALVGALVVLWRRASR